MITSLRRRRPAGLLPRLALAALAVLVIVGGAVVVFHDRIIDHQIRAQLSAEPDASYLADDGKIRVLLCGTGSPEISGARAQACTMVAAGGHMFLFDAGEGSTASLAHSNVDVAALSGLFLTHFHSDHFNGLGTLVSESWIWGRTTPLPVAGPPGTADLVRNLAEVYGLDNGYRAGHMPDLAAARDAAQAAATEVVIDDGEVFERVFDADGVTIDAVRVDHEPVEPAYGYVIQHNGKKVFVSGDTMVVPGNVPAMEDADLVVHEAYATHLVRRALPIMRELGQDRDAEVAEHTIPYHADTIELAKQAQESRVDHLVLTHLTPWPDNMIKRRLFVQGMGEHYDGDLTVGRDGAVFVL